MGNSSSLENKLERYYENSHQSQSSHTTRPAQPEPSQGFFQPCHACSLKYFEQEEALQDILQSHATLRRESNLLRIENEAIKRRLDGAISKNRILKGRLNSALIEIRGFLQERLHSGIEKFRNYRRPFHS